LLYYRHASSLEHDPRDLEPEHPDVPDRISAIEAAMERAGWPGCELREAPAATEDALALVHERGYDLRALEECVVRTIEALDGAGEAESRAPDPLLTSRVAAHVGHFWSL
jgi:acetoin utilization deacetylase AcuC-like enzyme